MKRMIPVLALIALIATSGCEMGMMKGDNMAMASLYDRLGGKPVNVGLKTGHYVGAKTSQYRLI